MQFVTFEQSKESETTHKMQQFLAKATQFQKDIEINEVQNWNLIGFRFHSVVV